MLDPRPPHPTVDLWERHRRLGVMTRAGIAAAGLRLFAPLGFESDTVTAFLPPPERRGLVLVDPPFEEGDDFRRFEAGLTDAHRRWATGIFLFWYPIKEALAVEDFARRLQRLRIPKILRVELAVSARPSERLAACGMIVVNPPWGLADDLGTLLPYLSRTLDLDGTGRYRMVWLAGEAS